MSNYHNHNLGPQSREVELARAKDDFRGTMLANDAFVPSVLTRLDLGVQTNRAELPDFGCEPTLQIKDDKRIIGIRLSSSRADTVGELNVGFAVFDHIKIASIDVYTGEGAADPALLDLLRIAGVEELEEAAKGIGDDWRVGYNAIVREFRGEIGIHDLTHTIELISSLEGEVSVA